ncbi:MAG: hypothetical protein PHW87_04030 [Methanothrix sp.]|nr:hypothetical protein [Methanothrix sp.]
MPDSKDVERRICKMLDMSDEELLAEMDRSFFLSDERHQRISDTLVEMMQEVDRLISRIGEIEDESLEGEDEDSSTR